jgi:hypothetical protein
MIVANLSNRPAVNNDGRARDALQYCAHEGYPKLIAVFETICLPACLIGDDLSGLLISLEEGREAKHFMLPFEAVLVFAVSLTER